MDPDYPCIPPGTKKSLMQLEKDPASPMAQCNPMHDPDYPCRTGVKKTLAQIQGPSPLPQCNPMHDDDYPCRTGVKKTLAQGPSPLP